MARARLTDEEREQRRKERVAFACSDAAYTHYDVKTEGFGSFADWMKTAEALFEGRTTLKQPGAKKKSIYSDLLALLGLDELPSDAATLKKAYRNMLFVVHPDYGGSTEDAVALNAAYARLIKLY